MAWVAALRRGAPPAALAAAAALSSDARRGPRCEDAAPPGPRVTTFGEAMIRYIPDPGPHSAPPPSRFASRWLRGAGGAELNLTIALANLGWGGRARWISVVPNGALGEDLLSLTSAAYFSGGAENLELVRRADGDVGIYHVWPAEGRVAFQRRNSTFGLMDPDCFGEAFWREVLAAPTGGAPHVLHLTGITPLIGPRSHKAWWRALRVARELRREQAEGAKAEARLLVTLDLNHRPALGTFEDLWVLVEPHLGTLDLLVLSVGDLLKLGALLGVPEAARLLEDPPVARGLPGAPALEAAVRRALPALQERLGRRCALAVCCKQRDDRPRAPGAPPTQLRWSMACLRSGEVVSTYDSAITQQVVEEIGGGDSWLSGCLDGLVHSTAEAQAASPAWTPEMWRAAMRRGDMMATLKQKTIGDFSCVARAELDAALAAHLGPAAE